jgi:putative ABC transport system permease protein
MFDYALKNISRRWTRSLLTISGVMVMMTLVIVITGIVSYEIRTMNAHASAGSGKINVQPILAGTTYPAEGVDMPESEADALLQQNRPYLQEALSAKVLYFAVKPPLYPNQPPEVILTGIESGREEAFTGSVARNVNPVEGVEFFAEVEADTPAILGQHAAEVYETETGAEIRVGDGITILGQEFTVIGILDRSADLVVNNAVIVRLDQAQVLLDKSGFISSVILVGKTVNSDQDILKVLGQDFPRRNVVTDATVRNNARAGIKLFEAMVRAISTVVLLCATLLIMTVMLITVKERTKEIGVLRALGASKEMVIGSVVWEIFLLSLTGSLLGCIASGLLLAFGLQENLFNLAHVLAYLPLAIVLTLAAGLLPAINISRILPVEALRYE